MLAVISANDATELDAAKFDATALDEADLEATGSSDRKLWAIVEPPVVLNAEAQSHGDMNRWSVSKVSPAFLDDIFLRLGHQDHSRRVLCCQRSNVGIFALSRRSRRAISRLPERG